VGIKMNRKELRRLLVVATGEVDSSCALSGTQIKYIFQGFIALGVDEESYIFKYWNIDEYETIESAEEFLWRNKGEFMGLI